MLTRENWYRPVVEGSAGGTPSGCIRQFGWNGEKPGGRDTLNAGSGLGGMLASERSSQKGMVRSWVWGERRFYTVGTSIPHLGPFPTLRHLSLHPSVAQILVLERGV